MRYLKLVIAVLAIAFAFSSAHAAKGYNKANVAQALKQAQTTGTCDYGTINNIVDWVIVRDPDASQKFAAAVHGGEDPYQALLDRLGHDQNSYNLISFCRAEAFQSLAAHGYH